MELELQLEVLELLMVYRHHMVSELLAWELLALERARLMESEPEHHLVLAHRCLQPAVQLHMVLVRTLRVSAHHWAALEHHTLAVLQLQLVVLQLQSVV
jgi:hypothetical protein